MGTKKKSNLQDRLASESVANPDKFVQPADGIIFVSRGEAPPDNDARIAAVLNGNPDPLFRDSDASE